MLNEDQLAEYVLGVYNMLSDDVTLDQDDVGMFLTDPVTDMVYDLDPDLGLHEVGIGIRNLLSYRRIWLGVDDATREEAARRQADLVAPRTKRGADFGQMGRFTDEPPSMLSLLGRLR